MRVVFAGTPDFAVAPLAALARAGHDVALVLTQPDRPAGRGLEARPSPVKAAAAAAGIPVFQPVSLKDQAAQARVVQARADVMVVAAYGLILPQAVLDICRLGAINVHASLLPRWRGAAPIQRAILAGDTKSGVCIMQMEAGLDTGPVIARGEIVLEPEETAATLHDKLAALGADLIVRALDELGSGRACAVAQPAEGVTYAHKIEKREAVLDWGGPALALARRVRAFNPFPGASSACGGVEYKIWMAHPQATSEAVAPGTILAVGPDAIVVACGGGALAITAIQRSGGKRLSLAEFVRGTALEPGQRFGTPTKAP